MLEMKKSGHAETVVRLTIHSLHRLCKITSPGSRHQERKFDHAKALFQKMIAGDQRN